MATLDLRMPGVYTQEISTLPPTVGVIPSAVPVFIGYTEKATNKGESFLDKPTRIKSMKEYQDWFGGGPPVTITVNVDNSPELNPRPQVTVAGPVEMKFKMYHSMLFYFANGGGPCYILSVGDYSTAPTSASLIGGIAKLTKVKEVTIIVFPDGTGLPNRTAYKAVVEASLQHCEKAKNRVTIIDVFGGDMEKSGLQNADFLPFQTDMPSDIEIKKYGMAYYPFIDTTFSYANPNNTIITQGISSDLDNAIKAHSDASDALSANAETKAVLDALKVDLDAFVAANPAPDPDHLQEELIKEHLRGAIGLVKLSQTVAASLLENLDSDGLQAEIAKIDLAADAAKVDGALTALNAAIATALGGANPVISDLTLNKIKEAINNYPVRLPPCGAIAGIYVRTDSTQGVWVAPANVSVFGAVKPVINLDDDDHASMNSPDNGKAINAIRTYPSRGLLVYGGRTLAGNDLEWRYVNVRRTFCFIEDSVSRAMQDFVFAPNTEQTWIKVRSMIRSFLNRLWKAGGLYGNTPEDAYQVVASEPESMSVDDVLNGIMRIYIKVAVARPAEFIVLQYEHKFEVTES